MKFASKSIHIGNEPEGKTGAIISPVYLSSTYAQKSPNEHSGYDYTRAGNPNFTNLEETLASLEQGKYCTVFSAGMGAISSIFANLKSHDQVLASYDLYGGTVRVLEQIFKHFNVNTTFLDMKDLDMLKQKISSLKPKIIFIETPSNPLLKVYSIKAIAEIGKKHGAMTVVDNTFASPYFQNPLTLGADVVIHSSTKYLGGHSDLIGGTLITNNKEIHEKTDFVRKSMGFNPSPFDAWLTSRSLKTLEIRMQRHETNALAIAKFMDNHPKVKQVYYPGLENSSEYSIAKKQMKGFGGMVSAEFIFDFNTAMKFISNFRFFTLAESLGGVESLVDHPASMTHASIPREQRIQNGLSDSLVRFSVGIENVEDLLADLEDTIKQFS